MRHSACDLDAGPAKNKNGRRWSLCVTSESPGDCGAPHVNVSVHFDRDVDREGAGEPDGTIGATAAGQAGIHASDRVGDMCSRCKFDPCCMEELPYPLPMWLDGAHVAVDADGKKPNQMRFTSYNMEHTTFRKRLGEQLPS